MVALAFLICYNMTMLKVLSKLADKKFLLPIALVALFLILAPSFVDAATTYQWSWCDDCSGWHLDRCMRCVGQWVASLPVRFALFLIILPMFLWMLGAGLFYYVMATISNWMIKASLIVPISPSSERMGHDFIVSAAWRFTRDFADMFLIIMLAVIGLATILRIKEYEAKKLLPTLIVVAILINFSPVIIGFVVDLGNIVTRFFAEQSMAYGGRATLTMAWHWFSNSSKDIWMSDGHFFERLFAMRDFGKGCAGMYFMKFVGMLITGAVLIIFFFYAAYVYIMLAWIFFYRIVALWIATILSPIMFVLRIFPATKKWYNEWKTEFIKWALVGIPLGFFLLLSNWIMATTVNNPSSNTITNMFQTSNMETDVGSQESQYKDMMTPRAPNEEDVDETAGGSIAVSDCEATDEEGKPLSGMDEGLAQLFTSLLAPTLALVLLQFGVKKTKGGMPAIAQGIMDTGDKAFNLAKTAAITAATGGAGMALRAGSMALGGKALGGAARVSGGIASGTQKLESRMGPLGFIAKPITAPTRWVSRGVEKRATAAGENLDVREGKRIESEAEKIKKRAVTDKQLEMETERASDQWRKYPSSGAMSSLLLAGSQLDKNKVVDNALEKKGWKPEQIAELRTNTAVDLNQKGIKDLGRSSFSADYVQQTSLDKDGKQKFSKEDLANYKEGKTLRDEGTRQRGNGLALIEEGQKMLEPAEKESEAAFASSTEGKRLATVDGEIKKLESKEKLESNEMEDLDDFKKEKAQLEETKRIKVTDHINENRSQTARDGNALAIQGAAEKTEGENKMERGEAIWGTQGKKLDEERTEKGKKAKPEDIEKASNSEMKDFASNAVKGFDGAKLAVIANKFGGDVIKAFQNEFNAMNFTELLKINPKEATYLMANALQEGGFTPPRGTPSDKKELKDIAEGIRKLTEIESKKRGLSP